MNFFAIPFSIGLAFSLVASPSFAQGTGHGRFHKQFRVQNSHELQSNEYVNLDFADLNGDGYPEMLYTDPYYQDVPGRGFDAGRVLVYDGNTGAELYFQLGEGVGANLGRNAHFLDDLTGDGIPEIAFTDHYQFAYHLHVLSGADFSPLINSADFEPFYDVISVGDHTGDSISDIAAVRYLPSLGPVLEILDGSNFALLQRKSIADVGTRLVRFSDLDGDGLEEVGTYYPLAPFSEDQVQILRGANLRLMQRFAVEVGDMSLLANAGDVDADGVDDVLASNAYRDHQQIESSGLIKVLSGATGAVLALHFGASNDRIGGYMASMGDLNGDGHADYVLGSRLLSVGDGFGNHPQEIRIHSGATHVALESLSARNTYDSHGYRSLAVSPATPSQNAFIGFADSFRRRLGAPMTTRLEVFRFGN